MEVALTHRAGYSCKGGFYKGGFYLFTFWSSELTEPITLPDNRCLTSGLQVQKCESLSV